MNRDHTFKNLVRRGRGDREEVRFFRRYFG